MSAPTPRVDGAAARAAEMTLIDELLDQQRCLTAVDQFAKVHATSLVARDAGVYRSLLPATAPKPGQQYAFEVDLDKCSGCKSCVAACHALNGLDDGEAWRTVGTLVSDDWRRPFQQTITTACHHCVDPACLTGCPVLAYEKDPATGIVRHLDDQCIGCQYCILKCPYEVPQFAAKRGIVRKCDMCSQRLHAGEAPACVQACPNEAIRIEIVDQARVREELVSDGANRFLPTSPDPSITLPTTRFISKRPLAPDLVPANTVAPRLQPAHLPLVWMLVWTQLGVGSFALSALIGWTLTGAARGSLAWSGVAATVVGLLGSVWHLGKPLKAWRSFLGWKTSWLSREIIAFGAFVPIAMLSRVLPVNPTGAGLLSASVGMLAVFCSGMVYHDTKRALWRGARSVGRFLASAAVLGLAVAWLLNSITGLSAIWIPLMLALAGIIKLASEHRVLRRAGSDLAEQPWPKNCSFDEWSLAQGAVLMRDRTGLVTRSRLFCGVTGSVILPLLALLGTSAPMLLAGLACLLTVGGELAERYLFFRCVVPPRMPGSNGLSY